MHLIINPSDIYYLTGVRSHDPGEILVIYDIEGENQGNSILCDARTSGAFDGEKYHVVADRKLWKEAVGKCETLSTDPDFLTQSLREKIEGFGVELLMQKSPIAEMRILKNAHEVELLRTSQGLNKRVYDMILPFLILGVTEESIARKIQILQLELGASGPSFPPIVAFGEHSAIPHHSPTERMLRPDDFILLDMGLIWQGYCSDMTRMVYQETIPDEARKIGELVTHVTHEIIQWAKPGMKVADLDKKARTMLGEYEPYFTHSLGHGVGIDIHEAPHLSKKSAEILEPGMIVTIEPGIYIPGRYGVRYEEMVFIDKDKLLVL